MSGILRHKILPAPGDGIPTYATLVDMGAAISAGDLAECDVAYVTDEGGYYVVLNGEATYVCQGASQTTSGGATIDYDDLITADTQLFLAPQDPFPGIRDYTDLYSDVELCDLSTLPPRDERGLNMGGNRLLGQYGSKAALQITGPITVRAMFKVLGAAPTAFNILDYAGPIASGTEDDNFLWNANCKPEGPEWNHETGAGVVQEGTFVLPGRFQPDTEYIVDFQRDGSDVVNAYVNGLQLRRLIDLVGATDGGDGDLTTTGATGGANAQLCEGNFCSDPNVDCYWGQVEDVVSSVSPTDYVSGRREWSTAELFDLARDDHASVAGEADVVACFKPTVNGLEDIAGTIDYTTDWATAGTTSLMFGDDYWTDGGTEWFTAEPAPSALLLSEDMSVTVLALCPPTNNGFLVVCDTISGGSHRYLVIGEFSSGQVRWFQRDGANADVAWTVTTPSEYEIREYHFKRTHLGDGSQDLECWERKLGETSWSKLTVKSTTGGSGAGTTVGNIPEAPSAGNQRFEIYDQETEHRSAFRQCTIRNTAVDPPDRSTLG